MKAPFLVHKMDVKVLPHIVCFIDGQVKDRLIGFEELGNTDTFRRDQLEDRLGQSGRYQLALYARLPDINLDSPSSCRGPLALVPPIPGVLVPRSKQNARKPVFGFGPDLRGQDIDDWD